MRPEQPAYARRFAEASRRAEVLSVLNFAHSEQEVAEVTVNELCEVFEAELAFVAVTAPHSGDLQMVAATGVTAADGKEIVSDPLWRSALGATRPETHSGADVAGVTARHLVLSPWSGRHRRHAVVAVGRLYDEPFDRGEVALLEAVTQSVGHALERAWLSAERDRQAARQAALTRAATALSATLITSEVLETLSSQVAAAFEADVVAVSVASNGGDLEVLACSGSLAAAVGVAEKALCQQAITSGVPEVSAQAATSNAAAPTRRVVSAVAAPIRVRQQAEGAVLVGYGARHEIENEDVELLTAFAEIAGIAWRNAADHEEVRRAAERDSLTGCLNHGAFQERLRTEIARAERTGASCALILLDMNEFKAINDTLGHLAGDAVLREVADRLRTCVRRYDEVGRYGGDEFALLLPATDEHAARALAERVLSVTASVRLPDGRGVTASAGVASWRRGETPDSLIARADHSMLDIKRARGPRPVGAGSSDRFKSRSMQRRERRRLRRLTTAARIGAGLSRLLDERAIIENAIVELAASLGYEGALVVRREGPDGGPVAAIAMPDKPEPGTAQEDGRGDAVSQAMRTATDALQERRTVLIRDASTSRSWLAVPVFTGGEAWGAVVVRAARGATLGDDDAQLLQSVADHLGNALQTAFVYEQLEQTHIGTAAALAAALEAKDSYTADHAESIAELAVEVGAQLGIDEAQRRVVRYGALFHDIGKIAIPDAILNKPGPLTEAEFAVVRTHPEVGEQILSSVPFLADVREIVRHDHERWDGGGYPDGLAGEEIPLGARIVLVVDAYHAMRSDRPYRRRRRPSAARAELLGHAGTQFDPNVVQALLTILEREPEIDYAST
jgi:diguanylate cyclase (GGDEF)-like protein/putative nucleotidyltransferase with HDIG domain